MDQLTTSGVDAITGSHISAEHPFLFDMAAAYGRPLLHLDTFETHAALVRDNPARYGMVYQTCPSEIYYAKAFCRLLTELDQSGLAPEGRRVAVVEMDVPSARIASPEFATSLADIGWTIRFRQTVSATGGRLERYGPEGARRPRRYRHGHPLRSGGGDRDAARTRGGGGVRWPDVLRVHRVPSDIQPEARPSRRRSALEFDHNALPVGCGYRVPTQLPAQVRGTSGGALAGERRIRPGTSARVGGWMQNGSLDPEGTVRALREGLYRGLNGTYFFGNGDQTPLSYPDGTNDPTLALPLITYQIQSGGVPVPISPELYGRIEDLRREGAPGHRAIR